MAIIFIVFILNLYQTQFFSLKFNFVDEMLSNKTKTFVVLYDMYTQIPDKS